MENKFHYESVKEQRKMHIRVFRWAMIMGVEGGDRGRPSPSWILKMSANQGCFLSFE